MRFRLRPRRAAEPAGLPALRAERALVALAIHSQQLDERLARMEHRLDELASSDLTLDLPTHDDLLEVRLHSARVSAELTQVAVELQARIDDLAVRMPAVVAEDRRQRRARTLAETIIDLSDAMDTTPLDLDGEPGDWAATA
jgi:methyl-accepting chemotaxis protein